MEIKTAAKLVKQEIEKLELEIVNFNSERKNIFLNSFYGIEKEHKKTFDLMSNKIDLTKKEFLAELKKYEKATDKIKTKAIQETLNLTQGLKDSEVVKSVSKDLGSLAKSYLEFIKKLNTGNTAKDSIENELSNFVENKLTKNSSLKYFELKLNKKLSNLATIVNSSSIRDDDHLEKIAKIEVFSTVFLESFKEFTSKKEILSGNYSNTLVQSLVNEVLESRYVKKMEKALIDEENKSEDLTELMDGYGVSQDKAAFNRSKLAMKGVKSSLIEFKNYFQEDSVESLGDKVDMMVMYLRDTLDHLNLAKACFVNDIVAINKACDMDTVSRDLINESLYDYIYSDKFYEEINAVKKSKKKNKM